MEGLQQTNLTVNGYLYVCIEKNEMGDVCIACCELILFQSYYVNWMCNGKACIMVPHKSKKRKYNFYLSFSFTSRY